MIKPNLSLNGCPCAERGFPRLVLPRAFGHCLSQQPPRHRPHSPLPGGPATDRAQRPVPCASASAQVNGALWPWGWSPK